MQDFEYWSPQQIVESKKYYFTMGQIRHFLLLRHRNGLDHAIRKIGKRLVIRMDLFDTWIDSHAAKKKNRHGERP